MTTMPLAKSQSICSRIGSSVHRRGLLATAQLAAANIWKQFILETIFVRYPEWSFDRRWRVRTGGTELVNNFETPARIN
jgi:hypothetical protein